MSIHPSHCRCTRCEPSGPANTSIAPSLSASLRAIAVMLALGALLWAASELRELLFTWSAI